jgi:hypothetical protein
VHDQPDPRERARLRTARLEQFLWLGHGHGATGSTLQGTSRARDGPGGYARR